MNQMMQFGRVCLLSMFVGCCFAANSFEPGKKIWPDDKGVHINAHGGGVLFHKGTYYWYGEHHIAGAPGNRAQVGIHVYSSKNLTDWTDRGIALPVSHTPGSDIEQDCVMERPKVLFNQKTGKFVMYFHLELKGRGYLAARAALAVADKPVGPFTYLRSFRPNAGTLPLNAPAKVEGKKQPTYLRDLKGGQMSRDMTLFVDDDNKAYHLFASEENATMHIAELTDDYLGYTGRYVRILENTLTEAPAICKWQGYYYLIGSGCTGWAPNTARLFRAKNIFGPWEFVGNPCRGVNPFNKLGPEKTWGAQSTFILPIHNRPGQFIAMFDIWTPKNPIDARYVWLPVSFEKDSLTIHWKDQWKLDPPISQ